MMKIINKDLIVSNHIFAALTLLFFTIFTHASSWPTGGGGSSDDKAIAIVTASSGNTYTVGQFQGTAYFDGIELNSTGLNDIYVLKINSSGKIVWAVKAGGSSNDIPTSIDVDESDNVYIGGSYYGTANFGGNQITASSSVANGFVAKLNSTGNWQWVRKIGTSGNESGVKSVKSIEGDINTIPPTEGSVFVSGFYRISAEFNSPSQLLNLTAGSTLPTSSELFLSRLEHDGDWVWALDRGTSSSGAEITTTMEIDDDGRVFLFGEIGGEAVVYEENFDSTANNTLPAGWSSTKIGSCIHGAWDHNISYNSPNGKDLFFADANYTSDSAPIDTSGLESIKISFDVIEGRDSFSEDADPGEDLSVHYIDNNGQLQFIGRYYGGGARTAGTVTVTKGSNATYNGFKLRFIKGSGAGPCYDYWHIDNIKITGVFQPRNFVVEVSNTLTNSPAVGVEKALPLSLDINDVAYDNANNRLVLSGTNTINNANICGASVPSGAFLASIDNNTGLDMCSTNSWMRYPQSASNSSGQGVTVSDTGDIYQIGSFNGSLTYNNVENQCMGAAAANETISSFNGNNDVFMVSFNKDNVACWLTGGNTFDSSDSYPAIIGEIESETGIDISTNSLSSLYITGEFNSSILFGETDRFDGAGGSDVYVQNWGIDGRPFQVESWPVGVDLIPPTGAYLDDLIFQPDFYQDGTQIDALANKLFYWAGPVNGEKARLIPLQPFAEIEVHWRVSNDLTDSTRIISTGQANWPSNACDSVTVSNCYQVHSIGAPVEINPASGNYILLEMAFAGGNATIDNSVFNNSGSGFSSLVYIKGSTLDILQFPIEVSVVRSIPFASLPMFEDNVPWIIGSKLEDDYHNEVGRTGYVLNKLAYYDGAGSNAAYNREGRTGQIIPVNRIEQSRPQDTGRELSVAWYHSDFRGVYWPDKTVRYDTQWPFDPDKIIVASQLGGEVLGQEPLDPLVYPSLSLYIQSDPNVPGFNPNDEHAIFAPSNTGTGLEAIFALRSDFGSGLNGDASASSDPYVLIKYYDETLLEWKMRIFKVLATGAGYNNFQFTGLAATTVSPPYPVRLLPGCLESKAVGQAAGEQPPPPFFQDYKAQIWAKSAGSGELMYYYPLQPGFFYDLDTNDIQDDINNDGNPDLDTTCVPWLARLPVNEGGTANPTDPIKIRYDITWPTGIPQLTIGETLLEPKNGLPDIINQAAIEVVYDDLYNSLSDPLPTDTLAQMMDPLSPRFVKLDSIPSSVATELQTNGKESILGSADGTIKLPAAILKRISYDPLNDKLVLVGLYDATSAGEPLLVPNVLSKNDRIALKKLDGGNGSEESGFTGTCQIAGSCGWDQAIEALFRLSRNPSGIERICTSSQIIDSVRQCSTSVAVSEDHVLIGFQDENNDYILEPFQAVGAQAALTAGSAQGSGFMTLAFNNDASLTPLPVSLNIIRVGCLQSPPPPVLPVDADIYASYQGQLQIIAPENIFDEQIVLRHSGDFGGNPDALEFEWFFHPDADGTPPMPLPDPENGQLNGWIKFPTPNPMGANEITIAGANIQTLSDNWYIARYKGLPGCNNQSDWSLWAGQPGATPLNERAQLAEGWVKRVLNRLNPFEARVQNFAQAATNNFASMLIQLGERYEGDIAMNNDPNNLNNIGLIEAYTTVMKRAMALSVDSTPPVNYDPANTAILQVASRLVDFYTLLGNEAYADAQDPMIGISTDGGNISLAPTIFNFQNQLASLLDEELVLLRGRDDSQAPVAANPVYNRLFWNFTTGDGENAYALSYNISDINDTGVIDEFDARIQFPQGHGDAWGHYLTATGIYYELLRHPFYSWNPRTEGIVIAGVPNQVDFLDERQFAETAAAKARTGSEIVDLTYRSYYVEDPSGQYQGYTDPQAERAWGVSEWGHRAGMAAYFDWVTANAIIPQQDNNPNHTGIEKIERSNIVELDQIAVHYENIQAQIDESDRGLNPLGLASGVVPFDIDPDLIDASNGNSKTHFEQVYARAEKALDNVVKVWDFANEINNLLRKNQDTIEDISLASRGRENDFENQLIEIFGIPYEDDIGAGGTYPAGYAGADIYHYMYIDSPALAGTDFDFSCTRVDSTGNCIGYDPDNNQVAVIKEFNGNYTPVKGGINFFDLSPAATDAPEVRKSGCQDDPLGNGCALGELVSGETLTVSYRTIESADLGFAFAKPDNWTGSRRAVGKIQEVQNEMVAARVSVRQALIDYDILRQNIQIAIDTLEATFNINQRNLDIKYNASGEVRTLNDWAFGLKTAASVGSRVAKGISTSFKDASECIPKVTIVGFSNGADFFSGPRCGVLSAGSIASFAIDTAADAANLAASATEFAAGRVASAADSKISINNTTLDLFNLSGEIDVLMRKEPALRAEIYAKAEAAQQLIGKYNTTLANGLEVMEQLVSFRRQGAAAIQEYRYEDMAFRIFRNDALQKYRAAFDQAARYVYLAAAAYDYETNLLKTDAQSGQNFLTDIVKERSIGQILNGVPVAGSRGLADPMARMKQSFEVLKGQMGFNNPDVETNRFSLRYELFRISKGSDGNDTWRELLKSKKVENLWDIPEFRRYARPFAPESSGLQPGIVITFDTSVLFGLNFFGNDLGPNDSAYDSSQFSTRVRGVGTWFEDYVNLPLSNTPRMYLFPVGEDILRSPGANDFSVRQWKVLDQKIPVPLSIGATDLDRFDWLPIIDNQIGDATEIRRYSQYLAYHYSEPFDASEIVSSSRLIGRSVWNRKWMMIIPGASFLNDPNEGLDNFIDGQLIPGGNGERDGNGVSDIHLFFTTYSYSGN